MVKSKRNSKVKIVSQGAHVINTIRVDHKSHDFIRVCMDTKTKYGDVSAYVHQGKLRAYLIKTEDTIKHDQRRKSDTVVDIDLKLSDEWSVLHEAMGKYSVVIWLTRVTLNPFPRFIYDRRFDQLTKPKRVARKVATN